MVLLVEEEIVAEAVAEAVVEAMVFGSDTMKVYLRKQSFSNNGRRTQKKKIEREREEVERAVRE